MLWGINKQKGEGAQEVVQNYFTSHQDKNTCTTLLREIYNNTASQHLASCYYKNGPIGQTPPTASKE